MATTQKVERVRVQGPNGRTVTLSKGAAASLLKNKADYSRVEAQGGADEQPDGKPLDKWTVDELKAYAHERFIDLGDATKKADILAAIEAAGEPGQD